MSFLKILILAIFFTVTINSHSFGLIQKSSDNIAAINKMEQQTYNQISKTKDPETLDKLYVKIDLLRELKSLYSTKPKVQNNEKLDRLLKAKVIYFDEFNNFVDYLTNLSNTINSLEKTIQHLSERKKILNEEFLSIQKNTLDEELLDLRYKITQAKLDQAKKSIDNINKFLNDSYKSMNSLTHKIALDKYALKNINEKIKSQEKYYDEMQDNIVSQNIQLDTQIQLLVSQIMHSSTSSTYLQNRLAQLENQKLYNENQLFGIAISIIDLKIRRYLIEIIENKNSTHAVAVYTQIQKEIQKIENSIDTNIQFITNYSPPNYTANSQVSYFVYFKQTLLDLMTYKQNLSLLENKLNTIRKILLHIQNPSIYALNKAAKSLKNIGIQVSHVLNYSFFEYKGIDLSLSLILKIIILLFLGFLLDKHYKKSLEKLKLRQSIGEANIQILKTLGSYIIVIVILAISLTFIGVNASTIALIAGALSVGLGFGLQNIANNMVSGIIIIFEQLVKPGDIINIPENNISGIVVETKLRSTIIKAYDNTDIIVPNSYFINSKVINSTYSSGAIKLKIPFIVDINSDIEKVKEIVIEELKKQDYILDNETYSPKCVLIKQSIYGLEFEAWAWIEKTDLKAPVWLQELYYVKIIEALKKNSVVLSTINRFLEVK
ncbi:Mechanosensitive ion channel [Desulfurella multipotens]|uniref:Mechanosensitive ion channel n=3 Tax=Desulfurella TaxID=33001 RepID=A0A1G6NV93_9BACT|nr:mechanosensitive ion channel domain-containing protein [Desulfurella multipotens]SDC71678.1 Mechanosensitive ion channel [Desulfurella multipotens]